MRVATWNIWWKFGPWEARQQPIADELGAIDADVCCLQEVWADDAEDQASNLGHALGFHVARTTDETGRPHRFGNALLSRWPILESHTVVLPGGNGAPSHRSALFCRVEVPEAEESWWFVSTHLEWRYTASRLRQEQLEVIVAEVARLQALQPDTIVVLGGDFNAVADSDEIRRLTGLSQPYASADGAGVIFTDAWAAVGSGDGSTWSRQNPHSANAQWPRRRLDAVFISWPRPKPTGNPLRAELFGVDPRPSGADRVVPSDHYGVAVELDRRSPTALT